jgi:hypothetical protein
MDTARSAARDGAALRASTMAPPDPTHLRIRVAGRTAPEAIAVPAGSTAHDELVRFLNRQGPYAQLWIRLASDEYVRYDLIESIVVASADELRTSK